MKTAHVSSDASARPELFALDAFDHLTYMLFDAAGNPVGPYTLAGPGRVQKVCVSR